MFIADLHIHSKYSRATSSECVPEHLELWARRKGIHLLGTGDFTHPAWRKELEEKLVPAEEGLYTLLPEHRLCGEIAGGDTSPRFVISGELSSIYKKNGKTRKVHNLILLPSLEAAGELSRRLEAIGNIHSDGRPILGLDSRDLLEITLEACPEAIFIPAHIWTPHFSLFGAFSGFDSIEECFEDLTPQIHALETGLSSDPAMNWRISALDRFTLVSNSDAHSPAKLGREANLLATGMSYPALSDAIQGRNPDGFAGTIEFYPEEGKYHYDGHRGCGCCLSPTESKEHQNLCPVCGKKLTIGVEHRVEDLADREVGFVLPQGKPFESLVPLPEAIAASTGQSASSVKVAAKYQELLRELGPEFSILRQVPLEEIGRVAGPCVEEGIRRMRAGEVQRTPGFDGEYGRIVLLNQRDIDQIEGQCNLFGFSTTQPKAQGKRRTTKKRTAGESKRILPPQDNRPVSLDPLTELNDQQLQAVQAQEPTVAVVAGPGTGKTRTLVARVAHLVEQCGVQPAQVTAVTFTNRAAGEMRERLRHRLGSQAEELTVGTFHAICRRLLEAVGRKVVLLDDGEAVSLAGQVIKELGLKAQPRTLLQEVSRRKNNLPAQTKKLEQACERYIQSLQDMEVQDFDDLLSETLELYRSGGGERGCFTHLLVDEFQDVSELQYQLVQVWRQGGLFVIGDPDQSIYGFRGASADCFERLLAQDGGARLVQLRENYRSTPQILRCALPVIQRNGEYPRELEARRPQGMPVTLLHGESEMAQAIAVAKEIGAMVGGIEMLDSDNSTPQLLERPTRSLSDVAVLYRTHRQSELLERCLRRDGIPCVIAGRDDFLLDEHVRGSIGFFRSLQEGEDLPSLKAGLALFDCPGDLLESFCADWMSAREAVGVVQRLEEALTWFVGEEPLERWAALVREFAPRIDGEKPQSLLEDWAEKTGLAGEEAVEKLINMSVFHRGMGEFLQNLTFGQEADLMRCAGKNYQSGAVTLMSLHGSKGLEFPCVFLCGVNKGRIPMESTRHPADLQEERRLFYVGLTRAKEELHLLTWAEPSPFLQDIPDGVLVEVEPKRQREKSQGKQLCLFEV